MFRVGAEVGPWLCPAAPCAVDQRAENEIIRIQEGGNLHSRQGFEPSPISAVQNVKERRNTLIAAAGAQLLLRGLLGDPLSWMQVRWKAPGGKLVANQHQPFTEMSRSSIPTDWSQLRLKMSLSARNAAAVASCLAEDRSMPSLNTAIRPVRVHLQDKRLLLMGAHITTWPNISRRSIPISWNRLCGKRLI